MRAKQVPVVLAILLAGLLAGCGESGPKRSVDSRTEALRFYAVNAPVVAVLRPDPWSEVLALNDAAGGLPAWMNLRNRVLGPLVAAGLSPGELAKLLQTRSDIEGATAAAIALGAPTPDDLAAGRSLLVLATDQSQVLNDTLQRQAQAGVLKPAGRIDEAALYTRGATAYAVRDGVLVSAQRLADVKAAIVRRDGDTDRQLDEDVVNSLFNDLTTQGPLLVYASMGDLRDADPGMSQLADQASWTAKLGQAAATAEAQSGVVKISGFAETAGSNFSPGELPVGTEPSRIRFDASGAAATIPAAGPSRDLLSGLPPVSGEASGSSDKIQLQLTAGG